MVLKIRHTQDASMKILFIHQNFPGQFKFLAPALKEAGHDVCALTLRDLKSTTWKGINIHRYTMSRISSGSIHPWLSDFETKVIRGEACYNAAFDLKKSGYVPELILAHPGWGESLFLKEVWPNAKLGLYCEFFYSPRGLDVGFDPEFPELAAGQPCRINLKNANNLFHIDQADAGLSPTQWQADTFPEPFRRRITVCHDGIDTNEVRPNIDTVVTLNDVLKMTTKDQVITYVARNLEPHRGIHIFLRALPKILRSFSRARVLIVGNDQQGYGQLPADGRTWKEVLVSEVRGSFTDEEWSRVHFVGQLPYAYFLNALQVSSVHVYLTYPFVLSWSLLEAMSVGCPIVASSTGPVKEAVRDGKTGKLFDFFNEEQLSESVCELLSNPKEAKRLGANARTFAIDNFDMEKVCLPRQIAWVESLYK